MENPRIFISKTAVHMLFPVNNHQFLFQVRRQRDEELTYITQELTFLQSNLLKEQKHLKAVIQEQAETIRALQGELDRASAGKAGSGGGVSGAIGGVVGKYLKKGQKAKHMSSE